VGGSVTANGRRVAVYLDVRREERGEEWYQGLEAGLLRSLCFLPLLSYGSTAPLAPLCDDGSPPTRESWPATPFGLQRLQGTEEDYEDGVLQVVREHHTSMLLMRSVRHIVLQVAYLHHTSQDTVPPAPGPG
jgi:hypothetical protein